MWVKHQISDEISYTRKLDANTYEIVTNNPGLKVVLKSERTISEYTEEGYCTGREWLADGFMDFFKREPKNDAELMVYSQEGWSSWSADERSEYITESELKEILSKFGIIE